MRIALDDLQLVDLTALYPGTLPYALANRVTVQPLAYWPLRTSPAYLPAMAQAGRVEATDKASEHATIIRRVIQAIIIRLIHRRRRRLRLSLPNPGANTPSTDES